MGEYTSMANNWAGVINLKYSIKIFQTYSITVGKSTDVNDTAQLAVFINSCNWNFVVSDDLSEQIPMHNLLLLNIFCGQVIY